MLSLILGIMTFTTISVYQTYLTGNLEVALMDRVVIDMWTGAIANSPVFGAYVLTSLTLFPLLLLKTTSKFEKIIIFVLILLGIVILVLFQSRGPFASAFIIISFIIIYIKKIHKFRIISAKLLILGLIIAGTIFYILGNDSNKVTQSYADRLETKGTDSARYGLWIMGLQGLYKYPLGGKDYDLIPEGGNHRHSHLHNMWLDMNYEVGILPLIFLLIFIFKHKKYFKVFKEKGEINTKIYLLAFLFALLLPTFFEPMINASFIFVALISFILALLKNYYITSLFSLKEGHIHDKK